uniref:Uncharacterized protein n=1 Tax=Ditylenchus dipsaci TaxID=166011 RepID=A0A915CT87_9BILA
MWMFNSSWDSFNGIQSRDELRQPDEGMNQTKYIDQHHGLEEHPDQVGGNEGRVVMAHRVEPPACRTG